MIVLPGVNKLESVSVLPPSPSPSAPIPYLLILFPIYL